MSRIELLHEIEVGLRNLADLVAELSDPATAYNYPFELDPYF